MKYGFVIDNRKCIGCHACTVACKSENDVPIGVNRTWVKQVEKGSYPDTKRVFSVLRCNQCTLAPCVDICPVEALFIRDDGIVDFDNSRCIGCKSCMQACPYDALYIDPETKTAAKCNYCAHRVDIGLEPACVIVCPEEAIISGDLDDPESVISKLLSDEQVTVRKPGKGTEPNVYYINGDEASLNPGVTNKSYSYIWNSQSKGVGHYAKYAETLKKEIDLVQLASPGKDKHIDKKVTSAEALMASVDAKNVYDSPDKGLMWGWEVYGYIVTKAVSTGLILVLTIAFLLGNVSISHSQITLTGILALLFLLLTGILLVKDLDQPKRFLYVLLRPQWKSWLVKGGYAIALFGALLSLLLVSHLLKLGFLFYATSILTIAVAILVSIYTAFLFAQAKARDFWQSPTTVPHFLTHSFIAGSAIFLIINPLTDISADWVVWIKTVAMVSVIINGIILFLEMAIPHASEDAKKTVRMIWRGRYRNLFLLGTCLAGNIIPFVLLLMDNGIANVVAGLLLIAGIFITEKIWVEAPQRIPLS